MRDRGVRNEIAADFQRRTEARHGEFCPGQRRSAIVADAMIDTLSPTERSERMNCANSSG